MLKSEPIVYSCASQKLFEEEQNLVHDLWARWTWAGVDPTSVDPGPRTDQKLRPNLLSHIPGFES